MDERLFISQRAGKLVWVNEGMYHKFEPNELPIEYMPSNVVGRQLTKTASTLGELRGRSKGFTTPEVRLFQHMFMVKEATLSSEIEGTRATIGDVLKGRKIEEANLERRLETEEINNYIKALEMALHNDGVISEALLKKLHNTLLQGVRGASKTPGIYKTEQNAIGNREDTLDTAKFVPASPQTTPDLMANFVKFINTTDYEPLYKIAITHYQFEAIHPFRDGNGRLGRLISTVQICREKLLEYPLLYISEYFNRNRDTYTEKLFNVSARGEVEEWILFFLKALEYQANQSLDLLNKLTEYKSFLQETMHEVSKSPNMHLLIDLLFREPYFEINDIRRTLNISQPAAWIDRKSVV